MVCSRGLLWHRVLEVGQPNLAAIRGTPSNPLATYMKNHGSLLQDQSGKYGNASNGYTRMNPAMPQVRQFLINITLEAIHRYDLDGILVNDRLAWPKEFGWDATMLVDP